MPSIRDLLNNYQTRYAVYALSTNSDHLTHQLLPANLLLGELYKYKSVVVEPSSIGWIRLEKTHQLFGSRLAQQIVKHVSYNAEHGFNLLYRQDLLEAIPMIRTHDQL